MKIKRFIALALAVGIFGAANPVFSNPKDGVPVVAKEKNEHQVSFNTKTFKYHGLSCRWAAKCTRSCVVISKSEATGRGGVPCKICGGR